MDPPFWYTVPYVIDLEELALQFTQTIQPGMFVSISDGKNSWTFSERDARRAERRQTHAPSYRQLDTERVEKNTPSATTSPSTHADEPIAGPFKSYGDAKQAAGLGGNVEYVRETGTAGVFEVDEGPRVEARRGEARKYWIVEQEQYGLWAQVGHFHDKGAAERFRKTVPGRTQIVHAYPSAHDHAVLRHDTREARPRPRAKRSAARRR